jgi:hypothetical protein
MTNTLTMVLPRERAVQLPHRVGLMVPPQGRDVAATPARERRPVLAARRWVAVAGAAVRCWVWFWYGAKWFRVSIPSAEPSRGPSHRLGWRADFFESRRAG